MKIRDAFARDMCMRALVLEDVLRVPLLLDSGMAFEGSSPTTPRLRALSRDVVHLRSERVRVRDLIAEHATVWIEAPLLPRQQLHELAALAAIHPS